MQKKNIFSISFFLVYFGICLTVLDIGAIGASLLIAIVVLIVSYIPLSWESRDDKKDTKF